MVLMILVDDAGGILPAINHSPWNGATLADFVMPFFLFIVGMSLGLTYKRLSSRGTATRKAILRALKLFILGLVLQGGYFHGLNDLTYGVDLEKIRWMGILQRIAIAYLFSALCEIWLKSYDDVDSGFSLIVKYRFQWMVATMLTVMYMALLYGLYVPDWSYEISGGSPSTVPKIFSVKCDVRGDTGPGCNAVGMIDRKILGLQHLYKRPIYARTKLCSINSPDYGPLPPDAPSWCQAPFDPEGLLRFIAGMHVNKVLYSFSYTCVTAGAAGILFAGTYVLVDVYGYRRPTMVMEWMGMNALMIYVLAACNIVPVVLQGFYWRKPQNNIVSTLKPQADAYVGFSRRHYVVFSPLGIGRRRFLANDVESSSIFC
ncbi:hypothetical protein ACLOJK_023871 [Asimina triloba]